MQISRRWLINWTRWGVDDLRQGRRRQRAVRLGAYRARQSFIIDHFFTSLPLAEKRRVHFHYFFRELHQRLNAQPALTLPEVLAQMTDGCRLLCFDEFHLHDPATPCW